MTHPKTPRIQFDANATDVTTDEHMLRVTLMDGREVAVPLEFFPRLRDATPEQRGKWFLSGGGMGIHWDEINEDISIDTLLRKH